MVAIHRGPLLTFDSVLNDGVGIDAFISAHTDCNFAFYRSGKWAFRDALDAIRASANGETVILPSYVPHAIVEPIYHAGLTPIHYRIKSTLHPDFDHLTSLVDHSTLAIVSVGYFGHPQPTWVLDRIRTLCDEYNSVLIDDAAHCALSIGNDGLGGTAGSIGFSSLHKFFPIPDGAVLYVTDDMLSASLSRSNIASQLSGEDLRFLLDTVLTRVIDSFSSHFPQNTHEISTPSQDSDTKAIYSRSKGSMSLLSREILRRVDLETVTKRRRANYQTWDEIISNQSDIASLYTNLEMGAVPLYYPAIVGDPTNSFKKVGQPWPPLPNTVKGNNQFPVANDLSTHLYTFPVHQGLRPEDIETVVKNVITSYIAASGY